MNLCTPACRLEDSLAEPIVVLGLDSDGQDIAFAVADSTEQPQQLQLTKAFFRLAHSG